MNSNNVTGGGGGRKRRKGQMTAPDIFMAYPEIRAAASSNNSGGGNSRPPLFPGKVKGGVEDGGGGRKVVTMSRGALRGESRSRRRSCLRRLIGVARRLGGFVGVELDGRVEGGLLVMGGEGNKGEDKVDEVEDVDEKVVDDTLEILCGHFEEIRNRMANEGGGMMVKSLEGQMKGKKGVSFGDTVRIESFREHVGRVNGVVEEQRDEWGGGGLDRVTSFGSDSIYEFVGEEVDAGDIDVESHRQSLRKVNGYSPGVGNTVNMNGHANSSGNGNGNVIPKIGKSLEEGIDVVDSDDETLGPLPVMGEGDPNRQRWSMEMQRMQTGRRYSNASSAHRRSIERAGPRELPAMMPGKKPSFHLDFPSSRMNSYMTNITSRNSIGPSPATLKEQQEQLHRDFISIFGSNDDTVVPERARGVNLIKVAGGELYNDEPLSRRWALGKEVAKSENASVHRATRVLKDGERSRNGMVEHVAVKMISKLEPELYKENTMAREIFCFRLLGFEEVHENVVQLYEICEDASNVYLVMEWLGGGELFTRISEIGQYTEKNAANLVVSMLNGIKYCHRRNVVHRDIKPENFVFARPPSEKSEATDIKLTDFGIAHYSEDPMVPCKTLIGTPLYMAPEILMQQGYGPSSDLWSLGVIVYIMLAGYAPFDDNDLEQLVKKIKYRTVKFDGPEWVLISEQGKQFITNLLDKDPSKRMTAEEALNHKWLRNNCHAATKNLLEVAQINIKKFVTKRRWKAAIHGVKAMNRMQKMARLARVVHKSNKDLAIPPQTRQPPQSQQQDETSLANLHRSPSLTRRMTTRRPPDNMSQKELSGAGMLGMPPPPVEVEMLTPRREQHREERQTSNLRASSPPPTPQSPSGHHRGDERYESGSLHWREQARRIREARHHDGISSSSSHDRTNPPPRDNRPRTVKMGDPGTQSIQVNNGSVVIRPTKRPSGLFHFCFR